MARLPVLALVLAGAAVTLACLWRGRREHPRSRAPWFLLAAAAAIECAWVLASSGEVALDGSLTVGAAPLTAAALVGDVAHLAVIPLVILALLLLPHARGDRLHRVQRAVDASVAALSFAVITWEAVLPAVVPPSDQLAQVLQSAQAVGAAAVATVAVVVLARSQHPGGTPFPTLGPVAAGVLLVVFGDVAAELAAAGQVVLRSWLGALLGLTGFALVLVGARRSPDEAETPRAARLRETVAVLAPLLPLVMTGALVLRYVSAGTDMTAVGRTMSLWLLVAVLVGAVLTRLESLSVSRTLEARVVERTLDLGTREKWFRSLVQHASDVVTVLDAYGVIRYQTPSAQRILGHDPEHLVGQPFDRLLKPQDGERLGEAVVACVRDPGEGRSLELEVWHRDGHWVKAVATVTSLLDDEDIRGLVVTLRDVSEHRRLEEQLTTQAFTDPLTGLANRAYFRTRVDESLVGARRGAVGVLFVDLNGFKSVNDTQGHQSGDRLLELVALRLRRCVRPGDVVARLGGDEFGILITGADVEQATTWVARRIWQQLSHDFRLEDRDLTLGASTGVAVNDRGDETADQLLRNADLAMYKAKSAQHSMFVRFEEQMHDALLARVQVQSELRRALAQQELLVYFQPVVELVTGRVVGAEALVRWQHPERGLVGPGEFIELAEETGLVHEIGSWALREACRNAVGWQRFAVRGGAFRVGVNVSVRQLVPGWPRVVRDVLSSTGLSPGALTLEVTESVLMERTDEVLVMLRGLRQLGVRLALDDFGTGYSSLSYLARLPVDVLKIDRSFIEHVGRTTQRASEQAEVARTIVRLGTALRLSTVAEGIETQAQREDLIEMGCDLGQGYLFARPMDATALTALLEAAAAAPGLAPALAAPNAP